MSRTAAGSTKKLRKILCGESGNLKEARQRNRSLEVNLANTVALYDRCMQRVESKFRSCAYAEIVRRGWDIETGQEIYEIIRKEALERADSEMWNSDDIWKQQKKFKVQVQQDRVRRFKEDEDPSKRSRVISHIGLGGSKHLTFHRSSKHIEKRMDPMQQMYARRRELFLEQEKEAQKCAIPVFYTRAETLADIDVEVGSQPFLPVKEWQIPADIQDVQGRLADVGKSTILEADLYELAKQLKQVDEQRRQKKEEKAKKVGLQKFGAKFKTAVHMATVLETPQQTAKEQTEKVAEKEKPNRPSTQGGTDGELDQLIQAFETGARNPARKQELCTLGATKKINEILKEKVHQEKMKAAEERRDHFLKLRSQRVREINRKRARKTAKILAKQQREEKERREMLNLKKSSTLSGPDLKARPSSAPAKISSGPLDMFPDDPLDSRKPSGMQDPLTEYCQIRKIYKHSSSDSAVICKDGSFKHSEGTGTGSYKLLHKKHGEDEVDHLDRVIDGQLHSKGRRPSKKMTTAIMNNQKQIGDALWEGLEESIQEDIDREKKHLEELMKLKDHHTGNPSIHTEFRRVVRIVRIFQELKEHLHPHPPEDDDHEYHLDPALVLNNRLLRLTPAKIREMEELAASQGVDVRFHAHTTESKVLELMSDLDAAEKELKAKENKLNIQPKKVRKACHLSKKLTEDETLLERLEGFYHRFKDIEHAEGTHDHQGLEGDQGEGHADGGEKVEQASHDEKHVQSSASDKGHESS